MNSRKLFVLIEWWRNRDIAQLELFLSHPADLLFAAHSLAYPTWHEFLDLRRNDE